MQEFYIGSLSVYFVSIPNSIVSESYSSLSAAAIAAFCSNGSGTEGLVERSCLGMHAHGDHVEGEVEKI